MKSSSRKKAVRSNPKYHLLASWWARHLLVIAIGVAGTWLFLYSRIEWSPMHRWNRAVGDMSIILVAAAMSLGPLSRIWRSTATLLPFRRELGIYAVLLAFLHATIILIGWVNLDLMRLVGFEFHPGLQKYVMVQHGFAIANLIGVLALLYGLILAATSNDRSLRWLGNSVWKFVQRGTYVLWWLSVVHTGYFLYLHFLDFHRAIPEPNWFQWPFVGLVGAVLTFQFVASSATLYKVRRRESAAS
ncbi:ferric reductase-like transmembrane domain-containing protein [Leisingera aquimarina]|uniref:ferric reductase-like transmembrane domain-containing protein n=1 Tax=Leisingera aquimarina TaxID=476529 RepID=UPI0006864842|nr:ferric reductase-like transmembrane domain-containing protein [Leisingera aquimarina]